VRSALFVYIMLVLLALITLIAVGHLRGAW
jgi:hypothetical protein